MDISAIFQNGYFIGILVIFGIEAIWVYWQYFIMGNLAIYQNRCFLGILAIFQIKGIKYFWQYGHFFGQNREPGHFGNILIQISFGNISKYFN